MWNLKDWIKNDPSSKVDKEEIENFVTNSEHLSICADVCNGSKHLVITRSRTGIGAQLGGRNSFLTLGSALKLPIFKARYKVISGKKEYDAYELATKCMVEWEKFMTEKNLKV